MTKHYFLIIFEGGETETVGSYAETVLARQQGKTVVEIHETEITTGNVIVKTRIETYN